MAVLNQVSCDRIGDVGYALVLLWLSKGSQRWAGSAAGDGALAATLTVVTYMP